MGILERIGKILGYNVGNAVEQADNPEKTLDQIIAGMAQAIGEARTHISEMVRIEQQFAAEENKNLQQAKEFEKRASRAVLTGRDDLAQDALRRKRDYDTAAAEYRQQWEVQHASLLKLQKQLETLIRKHDDAVRSRALLAARQRAALAEQRLGSVINSAHQYDTSSEASRIDQSIRQVEALNAVNAELNAYPTSLDRELAELDNVGRGDPDIAAIRNKYDPPKPPIDPWFGQSPTTPTAPKPKPEPWFGDVPENKALPKPKSEPWFDDQIPKLEANKVKPKDLWFDDNKPIDTPIAKPKPKDIWFDDKAEAQAVNPPIAKPKPKDLWFDDKAEVPVVKPAKPKNIWFEDEAGQEATPVPPPVQPKPQPKNIWFDDAPPSETKLAQTTQPYAHEPRLEQTTQPNITEKWPKQPSETWLEPKANQTQPIARQSNNTGFEPRVSQPPVWPTPQVSQPQPVMPQISEKRYDQPMPLQNSSNQGLPSQINEVHPELAVQPPPIIAAKPEQAQVQGIALDVGDNIVIAKSVQKISLKSSAPANPTDIGLIMTTAMGKAGKDHFIYHKNPSSKDKSVVLDKQGIIVDLSKIPAQITRLICIATFHNNNPQTVRLSVANADSQLELAYCVYQEDRNGSDVAILGDLYRYEQEWEFVAYLQDYGGGLVAFLQSYGIGT